MMTLGTILGQERPVSVLSRAVAAGRVPHAYLFEGVEGCGKLTTALALAHRLFCRTTDDCGECPSCRKMEKLQHPDLHQLRPDGQFIKIDQVRELQRELSYRPVEGQLKVAIIEEAERLNPAAGNALLKTLEEPPGKAVLILVSAKPSALLPTILSRCQRLPFGPLPSGAIREILVSEGTEPEAATFAAVAAGGSLARARESADADGGTRRRELLQAVSCLDSRKAVELFSLAEKLGKDRDAAVETLGILRELFRDLLFLQHGDGEIINRDISTQLRREAERRGADETVAILEQIERSEQAIRRNVNPRLTLDNLFLEIGR